MSSHKGASFDGKDCESFPAGHQCRSRLDALLLTDSTDPLDWNVVKGLLQSLPTNDRSVSGVNYGSQDDDPMGRLLMAGILSRNPPLAIVDATIVKFPECLKRNPSAFLVASKHASAEVLAGMIRQVASNEEHCPYPWILSEQVSVESAKSVLEAFPEGVWRPSPFLSSHNLLDYLLISKEVVQRRTFDTTIWDKFKLVLVAAECSDKETRSSFQSEIAPVQVILKRVLSRPDFWTDRSRVEHVMWLLHQLRHTDLWVFEKATQNGQYPIHFLLSYKCTADQDNQAAARALAQILLEADPVSASRRVGGKLPLHLAVENGWPCRDLLLSFQAGSSEEA